MRGCARPRTVSFGRPGPTGRPVSDTRSSNPAHPSGVSDKARPRDAPSTLCPSVQGPAWYPLRPLRQLAQVVLNSPASHRGQKSRIARRRCCPNAPSRT
ncbi:hypothetical protein LF41_401 [Lysobacter dokdonensis DS-58]|uniref:Uncharacterized protein n=1 Tax=Lysobacter dokdonensis DS-58 TaxID=1300345 RepID=A0A0A2WJG7_9GAMM|nr:hypothetical protein LF41_401 [Lysobacter dokdonensis DS-58]